MKNKLILTIIVILCIGCTTNLKLKKHSIPKEAVLKEGMFLCAKGEYEKVCILAENDFQRTVYFEGFSNSITLIPRKERWQGKMGLVSPKPPKNLWHNNNGVTRALIQEAEIEVKSINNFLVKINFPGRENGYNVVYNDNGLLIIWKKSILNGSNVLDLMLFQIVINGEKPKSMPGSQNNDIVIETKKGV